MAQINRRPAAVRRAAQVDPTRGASGSLAESYRSGILGAPSEFRSSTFDPDTASLDALKGRSGEISKAMAPAPKELAFSDTGNIRDVFHQEEDRWEPGKEIPGSSMPDYSMPPTASGAMAADSAANVYAGMHEGDMSGFDPEPYLFPSMGPMMSEPTFVPGSHKMGKALTTGRILREHPDKFKDEGEAGGRFFDRTPAIKRRIDPVTAFGDTPPGPAYGTPGGYKFLDEADYWGRPDSDTFFRGI